MATYRIEIPMWHPARLNAVVDRGWRKGWRLKKRDREMIAAHLPLFGVPPATGRRKVSLAIVLAKGQRAPDVDAFWKSTLDGLVKAGALVDDNRIGCQMGDVVFARSCDRRFSTTIILEDVEPAAKIPKVKLKREAS